jgi:hypothetical protein
MSLLWKEETPTLISNGLRKIMNLRRSFSLPLIRMGKSAIKFLMK